MILITGATGSIGRHLIHQLSFGTSPFKVFVRDDAKGRSLGCEYVAGDLNEPNTVLAALAGVDRLFLNSGVNESMVVQQKNVIDAAKDAGVSYVVKISAQGASKMSPRIINRWHAEIEEHLEASGLAWATLRPTYFMQNLFGNAPTIKKEGKLYGAFKDGRLAFVDCTDIAACATRLLIPTA